MRPRLNAKIVSEIWVISHYSRLTKTVSGDLFPPVFVPQSAETFYEVITFGPTCPTHLKPEGLILYAIAEFEGA